MLMIVLLHSSYLDIAQANSLQWKLMKIINIFCDIAVPIFFVISGYLFYRNFSNNKYISKLKSRFYSLIIPYFIWSILIFIYYAILTNIPFVSNNIENKVDFEILSIIKNILLANYVETFWFIRVLIVYIIFSPIIYCLMNRSGKYGVIIIVGMFLINITNNFAYSNPIFWLPLYLLGTYIALNFKELIESGEDDKILIVKKRWKISLIILAAIVLFIITKQYQNNNVMYYVYRNIFPILILIVCTKINVLYDRKINFINSFFILAIHMPLIKTIKNVVNITILKTDTIFNIIIAYLSVYVLTVLTIYILYKFLNKYFPKILNITIGKRNYDKLENSK
jgi:fucose 4-O-acetylase-like acetyltransferase